MLSRSRRIAALALGSHLVSMALTGFTPAYGAQDKCPLDVATCLGMYQKTKERPWLGVSLEADSLGRSVILKVEKGSPAERAGIRPGDVLRTIEKQPPATWFAGKAGWINGESGDIAVLRGNKEKHLQLRFEAIPEDVLARVIGVHMLEGHLAYSHEGGSDTHEH